LRQHGWRRMCGRAGIPKCRRRTGSAGDGLDRRGSARPDASSANGRRRSSALRFGAHRGRGWPGMGSIAGRGPGPPNRRGDAGRSRPAVRRCGLPPTRKRMAATDVIEATCRPRAGPADIARRPAIKNPPTPLRLVRCSAGARPALTAGRRWGDLFRILAEIDRRCHRGPFRTAYSARRTSAPRSGGLTGWLPTTSGTR
jgi:hypothetical protein